MYHSSRCIHPTPPPEGSKVNPAWGPSCWPWESLVPGRVGDDLCMEATKVNFFVSETKIPRRWLKIDYPSSELAHPSSSVGEMRRDRRRERTLIFLFAHSLLYVTFGKKFKVMLPEKKTTESEASKRWRGKLINYSNINNVHQFSSWFDLNTLTLRSYGDSTRPRCEDSERSPWKKRAYVFMHPSIQASESS